MARHAALETPPTAHLSVLEAQMPADPTYTLGGQVVHLAQQADVLADHADYFLHSGAPHLADVPRRQAEAKYTEVGTMLQEVRHQIAQAPDSRLAEDYLRPFLYQSFIAAKRQGAPHPTMLRWLADGRQGAPDSQLLDFTTRHLERLARTRQNPEDQQIIDRARIAHIRRVEEYVDAGRYDPYALKTLQKARQAHIVVGDVWDTHIAGRHGYYPFGANFVVVGQRVYNDDAARQELYETVLHELDHLQFPNRFTEPSWFREAMAEHNTQCSLHGGWDEFDPANRPADAGVYPYQRRLAGIVLQGGSYPVPTELATRAHTSRPSGNSRTELTTAITDSWDNDVLAWVDGRIEQLTDFYTAQGYDWHDAQGLAAQKTGDELSA